MTALKNYIVIAFVGVIVFCSCQPSKKMHQDRLYLQGIDSSLVTSITANEQKVQKADKLSITIYSDNTDASNLYNLGASGMSSGSMALAGAADASASPSSAGNGGIYYLVDGSGDILMPRLGPVHVDGLSKADVKKLLIEKLDTFLKHPYADIRFLNKRITMLGEITKPGVINMPEERLNILDAIALSGDLTAFARKDNIMIVREENGKRSVGRLDIKDPAIYRSPYFYLEQGDFVYIEPLRKKPIGTDVTLLRNITIASSLISTLAIVYSIFRR